MSDVKNISILIVEDDSFQLKLIESLLKQAGYSFVSVSDGHAAIEKLKEERFNLVVSDVNLPGAISGFNLVETAREIEKNYYIPFIFVTGRRDKKDVEKAVSSGVDDYILKPIDQDMLLAKIEALIFKKAKIYSFSERPVRSKANLKIDFEIDGVSEQAIQFLTPLPLPHNYKLKIDSPLFLEMKIVPPLLRITCCDQTQGTKDLYRIRANFIGLTEKEMNSIRKWILQNEPKTSKIS